jgi:hypothetical protein
MASVVAMGPKATEMLRATGWSASIWTGLSAIKIAVHTATVARVAFVIGIALEARVDTVSSNRRKVMVFS